MILISTLTGFLSGFMFILYKYYSSKDLFWNDLDSTVHAHGVICSSASIIFSIISIIFNTLLLLKFSRNNAVVLVVLLNYIIFFIINGQLLLYIFGWIL